MGGETGMKRVPSAERRSLGMAAFEDKYVHQVYEKIAENFSHTRYRGWPRVCEWIRSHSKPGDLVVDVGCGNGKYCSAVHPLALWIGLDYSYNLCRFARDVSAGVMPGKDLLFMADYMSRVRPVEIARGDSLHLPFGTKKADLAICVAVIHHLSSRERRQAAIKELLRVAKRRILIYVWSQKQEEGTIGARTFPESEMLVSWKLPHVRCYRYYKTFREEEIREEVAELLIPPARIVSCTFDSNNWALDITLEPGDD